MTDLVKYCPENDELSLNLEKVHTNQSSMSFSLFESLSSSFTKDLLVNFLNRDVDQFFSVDDMNSFVTFIGGRCVYDKFDGSMVELYWGTDEEPSLIGNCIRHGITLQTIDKNSMLLNSCMNMFPHAGRKNNDSMNLGSIMKDLQDNVKTDGMIDTITQLVSDENGIQNAVDMLQSLLVSSTMNTTGAKSYNKDKESTKDSLPEPDIMVYNEQDVHTDDVLPSTIFKKENDVRKKVNAEKNAEIPASVSGLLAQMNNYNLGEIQSELKDAIQSGELKEIVDTMCGSIDPMTMLQGLQNGSVDLSQFTNQK
jgi:hypothetical protein